MYRALVLAFSILVLPVAARASVFVSDEVTKQIYRISGKSLPQIERAMQRKGPKGFWAYTETKWNWDGRCNMRFRATVTMPKLNNRGSLSKADLQVWDTMIAALWAHEMEHVKIGRQWAAEIKKAKCVPSKVRQIDDKWGGADAALDKRTNHGLNTGVTLSP